MGFNSALFTVIDALLLRPLPFPQSDRLVEIAVDQRVDLMEVLPRARSVESAGAFLGWGFPVAGPDGVRMAFGFRVTAGLMPLLNMQPAAGRSLTRADFGTHTAMIGHDYWRSLGAPPDLAGRSVTIDGQPYFIVGVLPEDFYLGVRDTKVIVPNLNTEGRTLARLHPGVNAAEARREIAALVGGGRVQVVPVDSALRSNDGRPLALLLATAGLVLLIVCANLANLQLVRGLARRRELAIRTALGATRARLVGSLATESALLGAAGAGLGLLFTRALHDVTFAALPVNISRRLAGTDALPFDGRVALFTGGIAAATVVLFGILPAFSALRFDLTAALRYTARGASGQRQRFGRVLVAVETALALMLLAGACLAWKSLAQLQDQYLGFRQQGVLRAMTDFSPRRYPRPEQRAALFAEVERRLGGLAGVAGVGIVAPQAFPFGGPSVRGSLFEISGRSEAEARAEVYTANPAYLAAIGLPLVRGRWFTAGDTLGSQPVAVLSETVARRYWGDVECLGSAVRLDAGRPDSVWTVVVGVVGDVKNPIADHWQPTAYRPFAQSPQAEPPCWCVRRAAGGRWPKPCGARCTPSIHRPRNFARWVRWKARSAIMSRRSASPPASWLCLRWSDCCWPRRAYMR